LLRTAQVQKHAARRLHQPGIHDAPNNLSGASIQYFERHTPEGQCARRLQLGGRRSSNGREACFEQFGCRCVSVTADPETGDYNDEPTVFFQAGQLPEEFDLMP
jgi:hypothetical protein